MKCSRGRFEWMALLAMSLVAPLHAGDALGGDSEFGEIEAVDFRKSNWEPWKVWVDGDVHYYDNIRSIDLLAPTLAGVLSDEDDFVYRAGLGVQYTPLITNNLFLDTSVKQEFYRFDKLNQLDFDYTSADVGFIYVVQSLRDLELFARYRYEHLESGTFDSKIYGMHSAEIGAQQVYRFAPGQSVFGQLKARLALDASPDITGFDEYSFNAGYKWESNPFEVSLLYRLGYSNFDDIDRADWNNAVMLRGAYHFRDWLTFSADASFTSNLSDLSAFEYETYGVGAGLSFQMSF
ncbi:hypothetical protein [Luteolibacter sp. Populi]|uniref:hypothetical protein n=1 Tax=Luteolibacter sp. Populi TaxID=3230487 RepID=UPI003466F76B